MKVNVLIDSYGWIEYFGDGRLAEKYANYIEKANTENYITPSVVLYEVYKKNAKIVTSDKHLKELESVLYIE